MSAMTDLLAAFQACHLDYMLRSLPGERSVRGADGRMQRESYTVHQVILHTLAFEFDADGAFLHLIDREAMARVVQRFLARDLGSE